MALRGFYNELVTFPICLIGDYIVNEILSNWKLKKLFKFV